MKVSKELLHEILSLVQAEVLALSEQARAQQLLENLRYYQLGVTGEIPTEWQTFLHRAKAQLDPEYSEFKRLQRKFNKDQT